MRVVEYEELLPWLAAGVDVPVEGSPSDKLIRKGYLRATDDGYVLTVMGERVGMFKFRLHDRSENVETLPSPAEYEE
jgi:hypothetical protein